ncbi:MAG: FHA domain-containing protein [Oscillospiraceae bacterium]|nr:FHA domain-containing protein [Oscillospiraceae bacterium]
MKEIILAVGCFLGAAVLLAVAVIILVATFKKPSEKPVQKAGKKEKAKAVQAPVASRSGDETEVVRQPVAGVEYELRLISLNNLSKIWTVTVSNEILAGRAEYATIHFDDKSVSREQFRVISTASGPAVVHCGSTNVTTVNDQHADKPVLIKSGDVIKFGREAIKVEYVGLPNQEYIGKPSADAKWQQPTLTETQHLRRN